MYINRLISCDWNGSWINPEADLQALVSVRGKGYLVVAFDNINEVQTIHLPNFLQTKTHIGAVLCISEILEEKWWFSKITQSGNGSN